MELNYFSFLAMDSLSIVFYIGMLSDMMLLHLDDLLIRIFPVWFRIHVTNHKWKKSNHHKTNIETAIESKWLKIWKIRTKRSWKKKVSLCCKLLHYSVEPNNSKIQSLKYQRQCQFNWWFDQKSFNYKITFLFLSSSVDHKNKMKFYFLDLTITHPRKVKITVSPAQSNVIGIVIEYCCGRK